MFLAALEALLSHSLTDCHFRIWTQIVTFETLQLFDQSGLWKLLIDGNLTKDKDHDKYMLIEIVVNSWDPELMSIIVT